MGNLDTTLKVLDYVKNHPGRDIRIASIAKATGASTVGVTGIMRRVIKSAREPVLESRQGREITFRYLAPAELQPEGGPSASGEVSISLPTTNGHSVQLSLEQARKVFEQLKVLFGGPPQG